MIFTIMSSRKSPDPRTFPWTRLGMTETDWRSLAAAFYDLAHNDPKAFIDLPERLKESDAGTLCSQYLTTGDHEFIERAGKELTGSDEWYVYLGR